MQKVHGLRGSFHAGVGQDASVTGLLAREKLTERRVVRGGWRAEHHLPFAVKL